MNEFKFILVQIFNPFIRLVGRINWRQGRPFKCRHERFDLIREKVRPGMVILTHRDYELSNYFIRGYWTHSAIIISEEEIVEAVGQGVTRKRLDEFISNIDDFIILQPRFCDPVRMEEASEFVKNVIGYPYNYSFRPRTRSYYCSELVYHAYTHESEWNLINQDATVPIWDFGSGEIFMPQNMIESDQLWQIVTMNRINSRPEF